MPDEHRHLLDALDAIDPATLSYQEWVDCGMSLHESGFSWRDWDAWSQRDPKRYHVGECEAKWATFGSGSERVTSGTIIHMAERRGWSQPSSGLGLALDWSDVGTVQAGPDVAMADAQPIIDLDRGDWDPCGMLSTYLEVLFDDDEHVGYVTESWERDGRVMPKQGDWSRTAGELRQALAKHRDMGKVLGEWDESAGAWIRFNPLDGHGCGNANVTDYRYALVESDVLDIDRQFPAIQELHLPCAAVVSSGGKSVHAIVRIDAKDQSEYRKRVEWLYDYCDRHGFVCDRQNKNASRLSRMPGATRNGKRQLLLATDIGEPTWDAWVTWAEESEDELPDATVDDWDEPIRLKPMLIGQTEHDCILRQGAKMIMVGDSKMGKSYTLIDLAEAVCIGGDWLGMRCAQGKVFYVNLEIDPEEFRWRRQKVFEERPESEEPDAAAGVRRNFVTWNLRGYATSMEHLAPKLVRRVLSYGPPGTFQAIIIDPIYKVNGGDDNNAAEVAKFTNMLDLIISRCGCAVIYAHHHPKGATGGRKAIDRMSGSGVYGRDADTVLDFSPLFVPEDIWERYDHKPVYRAEVSCRSFGYRKPIDAVFAWPRFLRDYQGDFADLKVLGEDPSSEGRIKGAQSTKDKAKESGLNRLMALNDAFENSPTDDFPDAVVFDDDFVSSVRWGAFGIKDNPTMTTVGTWIKGTSKAKFVPTIQKHFEFMQARNKTYLRRLKEPDGGAD